MRAFENLEVVVGVFVVLEGVRGGVVVVVRGQKHLFGFGEE